MSTATHSENQDVIIAPSPCKNQFGNLALCGLAALGVFLFAMNWESPWEGDQPAKAAQIIEISESNNFFLKEGVIDYYKVHMFSFYYVASSLLYKLVGGDIFVFMNITSALMGVLFVVAFANSNWRLFRVHPLWTTFVLLAIPAVVINFIYGNEVAWSLSLLTISLMMATYSRPSLYYSSGPLFAAAVFCRADLVLVAPFWLAWVVWVARGNEHNAFSRLVKMCASAACGGAILWLLLLRTIPVTNTDIPWAGGIKLIVAMLVYPFNPSVILLVVPGWLWFKKYHSLAAWTLLLLLLQVAYYFGLLASPKYIMPLLLGYGLVVPFLLDRLGWKGRSVAVSLIASWFFFAVSIYGVFGPRVGSQWYLPTADGPCPTGAYLSFYRNARAGLYQGKQVEIIKVVRILYKYLEDNPQAPPLLGYSPQPTINFVVREEDNQVPPQLSKVTKQPGDNFLMIRPAYFNVVRLSKTDREKFDEWLRNGQIRGVGPDAESALPTLVEIGDQVPRDTNKLLGERILFMVGHYKGHMVHALPEFVGIYRSVSWVPTDKLPEGNKPVYQDAEFSACEKPLQGGEVYGFVWPAIYYGQQHPAGY